MGLHSVDISAPYIIITRRAIHSVLTMILKIKRKKKLKRKKYI
jgi:hypothetical protein